MYESIMLIRRLNEKKSALPHCVLRNLRGNVDPTGTRRPRSRTATAFSLAFHHIPARRTDDRPTSTHSSCRSCQFPRDQPGMGRFFAARELTAVQNKSPRTEDNDMDRT